MYEPETILISSPQNRGCLIVLMVIFGFQVLAGLATGKWFMMAAYSVIFVFFALQIPVFRDLIPILRSDAYAPIAGMGFLRDMKGNLWTVDDSLMILSGRKNGDQPMFVHVIGPAGWLMLTYANVRDPEFIKLWQRWNHPDPRPELASETVVA